MTSRPLAERNSSCAAVRSRARAFSSETASHLDCEQRVMLFGRMSLVEQPAVAARRAVRLMINGIYIKSGASGAGGLASGRRAGYNNYL